MSEGRIEIVIGRVGMLNATFMPSAFYSHVCLSTIKELQTCALSRCCSSLLSISQVFPTRAYRSIPLLYNRSSFLINSPAAMRYILAVLTAAVVVMASPFPQAVTAAISPSGEPPSECTGSRPDWFGIAAMNVTTASAGPAKRQMCQKSE